MIEVHAPVPCVELTPSTRLHSAVRALRERAARVGGERRARLMLADDAPLAVWVMAVIGSVVIGLRTSWEEVAGQVVEVEPPTGLWRTLLAGLPPSSGLMLHRETDVETLRRLALEAIGAGFPVRLMHQGVEVIAVDAWMVLAALTDMPPLAPLQVSIAGHPNERRRWLRASAEHWGVIAVPELVTGERPTIEQLPLLSADVIEGAHEVPAAPALARTAPAHYRAARGVVEVCRG